jgi:hypothetical protein
MEILLSLGPGVVPKIDIERANEKCHHGGGGVTPIFFVHIPSNWIEIRLSTKNQVPMLPGSTIKVCVVVGWWVPLNYVVTPTSFLG